MDILNRVSLVTFRFEKGIFGSGDISSRFGGMSISKGHGNVSLLFHRCIGKSKPKTKAQKKFNNEKYGFKKTITQEWGDPSY